MAAWNRSELPAISVYTDSETVDVDASRNTAPRELVRSMDLAIEAMVKATSSVDDALDDLSAQIEKAMHADETFGDTCADSILSSVEMAISVEGREPVGLLRMVYAVTYYTHAPDAADVTLDTFDKANIRHNLGGSVHVNNEAVDNLTDINQE